jgi:hypothetical protein
MFPRSFKSGRMRSQQGSCGDRFFSRHRGFFWRPAYPAVFGGVPQRYSIKEVLRAPPASGRLRGSGPRQGCGEGKPSRSLGRASWHLVVSLRAHRRIGAPRPTPGALRRAHQRGPTPPPPETEGVRTGQPPQSTGCPCSGSCAWGCWRWACSPRPRTRMPRPKSRECHRPPANPSNPQYLG